MAPDTEWIATPGNVAQDEGLLTLRDMSLHGIGTNAPMGLTGTPIMKPRAKTGGTQDALRRKAAKGPVRAGSFLGESTEPGIITGYQDTERAEKARFVEQLQSEPKDKGARKCFVACRKKFTSTCGGQLRGDGKAKNS